MRQLVATPVKLDPSAPASPPAREHPLGHGIKSSTSYAVPGRARIFLPGQGEALVRLAGVIGAPINGLSVGLHARAWGSLMSTPTLVTEVALPNSDRLLTEGVTPRNGPNLTLRRLLLGTVIHESLPNDADRYGQVRVAGVAILTVLLKNHKFTEDAWLTVDWFLTTRAAAEHLEQHVDLSQYKVTSAAPRISVVSLESTSWSMNPAIEDKIRRIAASSGFSMTAHRFTAASSSAVAQDIRTNAGSALLIIGEGYGARSLREAFRASANTDRVMQVWAEGEALLSSIREHVAALAGVTPSLSIYPPEEVSAAIQRPRLPVAQPAKCLHDLTERPYVLDGDTDSWWTRDTKGDGGSHFKRYRLEGSELVHIADVDEHGRDLSGKHKGPVGMTVPLAGLRGCAYPASHIS